MTVMIGRYKIDMNNLLRQPELPVLSEQASHDFVMGAGVDSSQITPATSQATPNQSWTIGDIVREIKPLTANDRGATAAELFADHRNVALPVVDGASQPIGLVARGDFLAQMAQPFGHSLYGKRSVIHLMNAEPLVVPAHLAILEVSQFVTERYPQALNDGFIVVDENGTYRGIGTGIDLMRQVAQQTNGTLQALQSAQRDLIDSEKFASLGQLVAGMAHEINTPIGIGLTAASHFALTAKKLKTTIESGQIRKSELAAFIEDSVESVEIVTQNIQRAADLIASFKQVAVDQTSDQERHFLVLSFFQDLLASLQPHLRKFPVAVIVDCPQDFEVGTYPGQLGQVLTNLVLNALNHAFAPNVSGTISIIVRHTDQDWQIQVKDNGSGMSAEVEAHLFEPFFTTKRGQGGTGLGLHIVHNLVTQTLQGRIHVTTKLGVGSQFAIRLPRFVAKNSVQPKSHLGE